MYCFKLKTTRHLRFLNQVCANIDNIRILSMVPAVPGFIELLLSTNVCTCVCVSASEAINNLSHDIDPYDWSNKFYGFCMAAVADIDSGCGISIYTH